MKMKTYVVTDAKGKSYNFTNKNYAYIMFRELSTAPGEFVTFTDYTSCLHLNVTEIGTLDCGFCCKIERCTYCEKEFDSHRAIYGCPQGN